MEKDPFLRRNDGLKTSESSVTENKWTEAMKEMPSYSEHMKQMRQAKNCNAFTKATNADVQKKQQQNAISRTVSNHTSQRVTNNSHTKSFTR